MTKLIKISCVFLVLCLITTLCSAKSLSRAECKAIMANTTAVVYLEKSKIVVPPPTPAPTPTPDKPDGGCANGNCPTQQVFPLFRRFR